MTESLRPSAVQFDDPPRDRDPQDRDWFDWVTDLRFILAVCGLLYVVACCLPAYLLGEGRPPLRGWFTLLFGLFGLFYGTVGWLANLLLPLSAGLMWFRKDWAGAGAAAAGAMLGLHSIVVVGMMLPADEADGQKMQVTELGSGFYAWEAVFFVLLVAGILRSLRRARGRYAYPLPTAALVQGVTP